MPITESEIEMTVGDEAPDFSLPSANNTEYSLSDFESYQALLIVFTCNHCPYAWSKIDHLNELTRSYEDLAIVGINPNDDRLKPEDSFEQMKKYVEDRTINFDAYLRDADQSVAKAYGAVCTPDPYLFKNEDDTFRLAYHGRIDDALNPEQKPTKFHMKEAVESVLRDETVDKGFLPSRGCSIKWSQ